MERRKKYEDAKDEILRQAKIKGIGIRELKMEFAKFSQLNRADCRRKLQGLGFKVDDISDDRLNLLLNGLENSGKINTDKLVEMFENEISEDQLICEVPEIEDDDPAEKLHQEGVLQVKLHGANDLVFDQKLRKLENRKVVLPGIKFDLCEIRLRQELATKIFEENPTIARTLRKFGSLSSLVRNKPHSEQTLSFPSITEISNPVESFYCLLDARYGEVQRGENNAVIRETQLQPLLSQPSYARQVSMSVLAEYDNSRSVAHQTECLHTTSQMQTLEQKRAEKLTRLQNMKQQALGDTKQTMALPRLIGGRKSGSSLARCIDCGERVQIAGRASSSSKESFACNGSSCGNVFCSTCFSTLPASAKLCDHCFKNEYVPEVVFGDRLRLALIDKIGTSETQRAQLEDLFREFDVDHSGKLSPDEFSRALFRLHIQPPLTTDQTRFLLNQFDTNQDGEVSFAEFKSWILHDHVWDRDISERANGNVEDVLSTVIIPACNDIIEAAMRAIELVSTTNQWSYTSSSLSAKPTLSTGVPIEQGAIFFNRVVAIRGDEDSSRVIKQLLDRFDTDRTGDIDKNEFADLLLSFGIQAEPADVHVMMKRINFYACKEHNHHHQLSISIETLTAFINDLSSRSELQQYTSRLKVNEVASILTKICKMLNTSSSMREKVLAALSCLEWSMESKAAVRLCHYLRHECTIEVDPTDILRLAKTLCFDDTFLTEPDQTSSTSLDSSKTGTRTTFRRSVDILLGMLLSNTLGLTSSVATFNLNTVVHELEQSFSTIFAGLSIDTIWRKITGVDGSSMIDQREFMERLVTLGLSLSSGEGVQLSEDNDKTQQMRRLVTKLMLSLALDAMRVELQDGSQSVDHGNVTQSLMTIVFRYSKILDMERQWARGLSSAVRFSNGDQRFLVSLSINQERCLVIRATDPMVKSVADFILQPCEYSYANISTQLPQIVQTNNSQALVTYTFYPQLNAAIFALIGRLRIYVISGSVSISAFIPFLSLVEEDEFVSTVRGLLVEISPPFFFAVTPESLDFSIDIDCLLSAFPSSSAVPSFVQRVADVINTLRSTSAAARAFYSTVVNTSSSLSVRFDIVGRKNRVVLDWSEFQGYLAGLQDTYAVVQVLPQGDVFSTCVAPAGVVGATAWDFERAVLLKEPLTCDLRIDRPIVYTDTVKVATVNGPNGAKTAFVGTGGRGPAHFVVVTARKAVVSTSSVSTTNQKKSRLYCTAYDPWTSCDYAVEGYPDNWSADFFNPTVNPDFELQWQELLRNMYLGISLTPTLSIKVYSKQLKVDQLVGECEVTVASAIARDGHLFEASAALKHPTRSGVTTGRVRLTFSFDATKASDAIAAADQSAPTRTRLSPRIDTPSIPINVTVSQDNTVQLQQEFDVKLRDLRAQLQVAEQARNDSNETVKMLKRQLQQAASAANSALGEEATKWKRELEQILRDQEDKDKRYFVFSSAINGILLTNKISTDLDCCRVRLNE